MLQILQVVLGVSVPAFSAGCRQKKRNYSQSATCTSWQWQYWNFSSEVLLPAESIRDFTFLNDPVIQTSGTVHFCRFFFFPGIICFRLFASVRKCIEKYEALSSLNLVLQTLGNSGAIQVFDWSVSKQFLFLFVCAFDFE